MISRGDWFELPGSGSGFCLPGTPRISVIASQYKLCVVFVPACSKRVFDFDYFVSGSDNNGKFRGCIRKNLRELDQPLLSVWLTFRFLNRTIVPPHLLKVRIHFLRTLFDFWTATCRFGPNNTMMHFNAIFQACAPTAFSFDLCPPIIWIRIRKFDLGVALTLCVRIPDFNLPL